MPKFFDAMTEYPIPCRHSYGSGSSQTGFHPADQTFPFSSRR